MQIIAAEKCKNVKICMEMVKKPDSIGRNFQEKESWIPA